MESVGIGLVIIAITEGLKKAFPGITGYITIALAAVLGLLAGVAGIEGLTWFTGLLVGLGAAGGIKVATSFSGK